MTDLPGVPARELSDEELERQGVQAHATRHWVFLHGTAEQFRTHTERMLELEQEYLRRHARAHRGRPGVAAGPRAELIVRRPPGPNRPPQRPDDQWPGRRADHREPKTPVQVLKAAARSMPNPPS